MRQRITAARLITDWWDEPRPDAPRDVHPAGLRLLASRARMRLPEQCRPPLRLRLRRRQREVLTPAEMCDGTDCDLAAGEICPCWPDGPDEFGYAGRFAPHADDCMCTGCVGSVS